jgi:hypothetical protein
MLDRFGDAVKRACFADRFGRDAKPMNRFGEEGKR